MNTLYFSSKDGGYCQLHFGNVSPKALTNERLLSLVSAVWKQHALEKELHLVLTDLDVENVSYKTRIHGIDSAVAQVALLHLDAPDEARLPIQIETTRSLINRFSFQKKGPEASPLFRLFSAFFGKIQGTFAYIDFFFKALFDSKREMDWNLNLLSDLAGSPLPSRIRLRCALGYIRTLLEKEVEQEREKGLLERLQIAESLSVQVEALRIQKNPKRLEQGIKRLSEETLVRLKEQTGKNEPFLMPVGYWADDRWEEQLLEVRKNEDGRYDVAWLCPSESGRKFFDTRVAGTKPKDALHAMKREIGGVQKKDLEATIQSWIKLQTIPPSPNLASQIQAGPTQTMQSLFLETLRFNNDTTLKFSAPVEKEQAGGMVNQLLSYAKQNQGNLLESRRFEVAARLRLFLDLCNTPSARTNLAFRKIARHFGIQIAREIEREKELISSELSEQGKELGLIFAELNSTLDRLDQEPISMLETIKGKFASWKTELNIGNWVSGLTFVSLQAKSAMPLSKSGILPLLDQDNLLGSITTRSTRCTQLIKEGRLLQASLEVQETVQHLPDAGKPFWNELTSAQAEQLLKDLRVFGHALEVYARTQPHPTAQEIGVAAVLQVFGNLAAQKVEGEGLLPLPQLFDQLKENLLLSCLPPSFKHFLRTNLILEEGSWEKFWGDMQKSELSAPSDAQQRLYRSTGYLMGLKPVSKWNSDLFSLHKTDGAWRGVSWKRMWGQKPAFAVNSDLVERIVPEFAKDLLKNFAKVDLVAKGEQPKKRTVYSAESIAIPSQMRELAPHLLKQPDLTPEDWQALLSLQQTAALPKWINEYTIDEMEGGQVFHRKEDLHTRFLNAGRVFLERPHLLKHKELRWLFEQRFLGPLDELFQNKKIQPFLNSWIPELKKAIVSAQKTEDLDQAAYLLSVASQVKQCGEKHLLEGEGRDAFTRMFEGFNFGLRFTFAEQLLRGLDETSLRQQEVVLPIFLSAWLDKLETEPNLSEEQLVNILAAIGRLEHSSRESLKIDPELRIRYHRLLHVHLLPKIQENTPKLASKVLVMLQPNLGGKISDWDTSRFPELTAKVKDTIYNFNILTGHLYLGTQRVEELPHLLQGDPRLQRLFGSLVEESWQVSGDREGAWVAYTHPQSPKMRIVISSKPEKGGSQLAIQRLIEQKKGGRGVWATYLPTRAEEREAAKKSNSCWFPDDPTLAPLLNQDSEAWLPEGERNLLLFFKGSSKPYAKLELNKAPGKLTLDCTLSIKHVQDLRENMRLLNVPAEKLAIWGAIENPSHLLAWGDRQVKKVQFPRLSLSYTLSKSGPMADFRPGFVLQAFGKRPGGQHPHQQPLPRTFEAFHLLQKGREEAVCIPFGRFETENSLPIWDPKGTTQPVFEFEVDSHHALKSPSAAGYGYLAYLSLVHRDYLLASKYLAKAEIVGYKHDPFFDQVMEWADQWNDDSTEAKALKLRFCALLEHRVAHRATVAEKEPIGLLSTEQQKKIAELYLAYRRSEQTLDPSLRLSLVQEKRIQAAIKKLLDCNPGGTFTENSPVYQRALGVSAPHTGEADERDPLGVRNSLSYLWIKGGNENISSTVHLLSEADWVGRHFKSLFNTLLTLPTTDLAFLEFKKQLQLRVQSKEEGTPGERMLSCYLLKLIAAKEMGNQPLLDGIKEKGVLPLRWNLSFETRRWWRHKKLQEELAQSIPKTPEAIKQKKDSFYGVQDSRDLSQIEEILALLDPTPIPESAQTQQADPVVTRTQSYKSRYEDLLKVRAGALPQASAEPDAEWWETNVRTQKTEEFKPFAPLLKGLGAYFEVVKQPPSRPGKISFFEGLKAKEGRAFKRHLEEHRRDCETALGQKVSKITLAPEKAEQLLKKLQTESVDCAAKKEALEQEIFKIVEGGLKPTGIDWMKRLVGKKKSTSITQLMHYWRRDAIDQDWDNHPFGIELGWKKVSRALLSHLDRELTRYMKLATQEQHLKRTVETAQEIVETIRHRKEPDSNQVQTLYAQATAQRFFEIGNKERSPHWRDLLFLEKEQGILLRAPQVATLLKMIQEPSAVVQLQMGGGKSKVLLPLLAKAKANGTNLALLLLPEELYETNFHDLDQTNRELFGQEMCRFEWSRGQGRCSSPSRGGAPSTQDADGSLDSLKNVYHLLLSVATSKGFLITTKKSLLSFRNTTIELMKKLGEAKGEENQKKLAQQVEMAAKIMRLFQEKADVVADEVDACLDCRKEVNFGLGEAQTADVERAKVGLSLMHLLLDAGEGTVLERFKKALLLNMQASSEDRQQAIEELAAAFCKPLAENFGTFREREADVVSYLLNRQTNPALAVEKWVLEELPKTNRALSRQLISAKAFLNIGFGQTFGKSGNVRYGRLGEATIPYQGSNSPSVRSQFDEEVERVAYTIQDYLQQGATTEQFQRLVSSYRKRGVEEIRRAPEDSILGLDETEAARDWQQFLEDIGLPTQGPTASLSAANSPKIIAALARQANKTPKGRLAFCEQAVLSKLTFYREQISSGSVEVAEMVRSFGGFTGTPWNRHTYPKKITAEKSLGVDGRTWALLLHKKIQIDTFEFNPHAPVESLLQDVWKNGKLRSQALIDTGAYLRGMDNETVMGHVLKLGESHPGSLEGAVYFNQQGEIVKKSGVDPVVSLDKAKPTDLLKTFTLYDQTHTVGADIRQAKTAEAVVTIGDNTFIRDLFQAVWRMRGFDQQQTVRFALSKELEKRLLKPPKTKLTIEDILEFCLENEVKREAEDNFRAVKRHLEGQPMRESLTRFILDVAKGGKSAEWLMKASQQLTCGEDAVLIKRRLNQSEQDQAYGRLEVALDPVKELQKKGWQGKGGEENLFPETISKGQVEDAEVEQQAEAQAEMEMEVATETETQSELELQVEQQTVAPPAEIYHYRDPFRLDHVIKYTFDMRKRVDRHTMVLKYPNGGVSRYEDVGCLNPVDHSIIFDRELQMTALFEPRLSTRRTRAFGATYFYTDRPKIQYLFVAKQKSEDAEFLISFYKNRLEGINIELSCSTTTTTRIEQLRQEKLEYEKKLASELKGLFKWKAFIPAPHEAHGAFRDWTERRTDGEAGAVVALSSGSPLVLYQTENGLIEDPTDRDQFYRFYVQAKLLNGEVEFSSAEEKAALRAWLIEKGAAQFKAYFEKEMLPAASPLVQKTYRKSTLARMLQELI